MANEELWSVTLFLDIHLMLPFQGLPLLSVVRGFKARQDHLHARQAPSRTAASPAHPLTWLALIPILPSFSLQVFFSHRITSQSKTLCLCSA